MNEVVAAHAGKVPHGILDNLNTHESKHDRWPVRRSQMYFRYTPTCTSWLNVVESWCTATLLLKLSQISIAVSFLAWPVIGSISWPSIRPQSSLFFGRKIFHAQFGIATACANESPLQQQTVVRRGNLRSRHTVFTRV